MHFEDILKAIDIIDGFLEGFDFAAYEADLKTRSAVERQLQIVTEAAYRLGDEGDELCPGPDWKGLMGMGNILRHAYHRIDDRIVWNTVRIDLPPLKEAILHALASMTPEAGL